MIDIKHIKKMCQKVIDYKDIDHIVIPVQEQKTIIAKADLLLDQTFVFDKPWDMERCSIPYKLDILNWETICHDDEEWCFMLNRMEYLDTLINAYIISKDTRYIQKAKYYIIHWINSHVRIVSQPSTRTLDTAIRMMSMFETVPYLLHYSVLKDEELELIFTSIYHQALYLKENYQPKYTLSNWGSIQVGILCIILDIYPKQGHLYSWVEQEIQQQLQIQIYEDGLQWEQSTMYHVEVLNILLKVIYYKRVFNQICNQYIIDTAEKMSEALYQLSMPNNEIECFGDTDRVTISAVMERASYLFSNGILKYFGNAEFDAENMYYFGACANQEYKNLPLLQPALQSFDGYASGVFTTRSCWGSSANFTMFTNGSLGSGHGHSDNLHVSLCMNGKPVLIDSGRYTYREDHEERIRLKSVAAHNSLVIDDHPSCIPSGSWTYSDFTIPTKTYVKHDGKIHYYEGSVISKNPLQIWTRKLVTIDSGIWFICDEVKCDGTHQIKQYFHFDPMYHEIPKNIWTYEGDMHVEEQFCSFIYNEQMVHQVGIVSHDFTDTLNVITTFHQPEYFVEDIDVIQAGETIVSKDIVNAKQFIVSRTENYTIAVFHQEIFSGRKIMYLNGVPFHAKVIVIHEKDGNKTLYVMRT